MVWTVFWVCLLCLQTVLGETLKFLSTHFPDQLMSIRARLSFESKNDNEDSITQNVKHAFHISSEGEFSQVFPLVNSLIEREEILLIMYTSPSFESKASALKKKFGPQLIFRRICFLHHNDYRHKLRELDSLTLCRYDFLPELMLIGRSLNKFFLINATSLKWRSRSVLIRTIYYYFYSQFNLILTSTQIDFKIFRQSCSLSVKNLDLRAIEIKQRQKKFSSDNSAQREFFLNNKVIVFGSAWDTDMKVVKYQKLKSALIDEKLKLVIFPHILTTVNIKNIQEQLESEGIDYLVAKSLDEFFAKIRNCNVLIVEVKGVLCELYPFFSGAFIGGGFGSSVHSVLEPMLGGCPTVCGPVVHRSTEVEFFKAIRPESLHIAADYQDAVEAITRLPKLLRFDSLHEESVDENVYDEVVKKYDD